ncbi:FAD binding domain protein [Camillea tinctor]|nr:FAD binding domain protein [Camillea tinctor]
MATENRLRIIIVGSGIAGLAAALTVYERGETTAATAGQGVANMPNGSKILNTLGFDYDRSGSVEISGWKVVRKDGTPEMETMIDWEGKYGAPLATHMRADFRAELLRIATLPSNELGVDPEAGVVTLSDGSTAEGDVTIGNCGWHHSHLRSQILGDAAHTHQKTGLTCFRLAVSEDLLGYLPDWWDTQLVTGKGFMHLTEALDGNHRMVLAYLLLMVRSWFADGDCTEVLETFKDFETDLLGMLCAATEVKLWDFQDLEPLPTWTSGRAILIGDAAHAMTPMQGQGGNIGIEDAEAFRLLMQPRVTRDDVPVVLKKIDSLRRLPASKVFYNTRDMSIVEKPEERYARMGENCTYDGILNAAK